MKKAKHLIAGGDDDKAFDRGLLELGNTLHHDGRSPTQIFYGGLLHTAVLAHRCAFAPEWQAVNEECDAKLSLERERVEWYYNHSSRVLPPLRIGTLIGIQDHDSGHWSMLEVVVGIGKHRNYHVKVPNTMVFRRNRRFLWPRPGTPPASAPSKLQVADHRTMRFLSPSPTIWR